MGDPIGRADECLTLSLFLDRVASGHGGVVLLEGEGGSGKTTLAEWAAADATERGFEVLSARSWELSQSVPYEPIVAALSRFLRRRSADQVESLTTGLHSLGMLLEGLGLSTPDPQAHTARARLHDSIATLVSRIAADQPVLFLVDDLQWADTSSLEVLQFLSRDLPYVQVGLVLTVRPDDADDRVPVRRFISPLRRASFTSSITVRNLSRTDTAELIDRRLGGSAPDRLVDLIWARSIGTPLVAIELIEDLLARNVLVGEDGGWVLREQDPDVPRAIAELIRDRIDRLTAAEREVLDVIAVADAPTSAEVLARACSLERDEIDNSLAQLRQRRILADAIDEDGQIRWQAEHPIIGRVIADELDETLRQRLHRRLALVDERASLSRRARHILRGGPPADPAQAARVLAEAGHEARVRGAYEVAIDTLSAAAELLEGLEVEASSALDRLFFTTSVELGSALQHLRRFEEATEYFERAWSWARHRQDRRSLVSILPLLDRVRFHQGHSRNLVMRRIAAVAELLERAGDWDLLAEVLHLRLLIIGRSGEFEPSGELDRSIEALSDRELGPRGTHVCRLMEFYARSTDRPSAPAIDRLRDATGFADNVEHGADLRYRALLFALDYASQLALPEHLDPLIERVRTLGSELGQIENWRLPWLVGLARAESGRQPEELGVLRAVGALDRSVPLIHLLLARIERYRRGPEAALAAFDDACTAVDASPDLITRQYRAFGRLLLGDGLPIEAELAELARASAHGEARIGTRLAEPAIFGYAEALAEYLADPGGVAGAALQRLDVIGAGRGMPAASAELIRARQESGAPAAAIRLLTAADHLDECHYYLAAAERRIEAAKLDRATVPDEVLRSAMAAAATWEAGWLIERGLAVDEAIAPTPGAEGGDHDLTKREWEVACEVAEGLTNREVASRLFISIRTVTSHLDHIYTKLGISSREELTGYVATHRAASANT